MWGVMGRVMNNRNGITYKRKLVGNSGRILQKNTISISVGTVEGKHIRLQWPKNSGTQYYNYKNVFSLVLFAICNSNYCFIIIDVGYFGNESDCNIFKQCPFGKNDILTK